MLTEFEKAQLKEKFEHLLIKNNENNLNYKRTNYDRFDAYYPDSIIVEAEVAGSKGGSCWNNDGPHRYEKEQYEIAEDLASSLKSNTDGMLSELECVGIKPNEIDLLKCLQSLTENCPGNEVGEYTYNEYYGNYTEYGFFAIKLNSIFEVILNEEQLEIFKEVINKYTNNENEKQEEAKRLKEEAKRLKEEEQLRNKLEEDYKILVNKIENHANERNKFKSQLEVKIQQAEQLLASFNEDTEKSKINLLQQKEDLSEKLKELGIETIKNNKSKLK